VTVAGTVGHWWFEPSEASSCCSQAVIYAFVRTVTTSFGSICFGSLIVAVLEALKAVAHSARQEAANGILLCLAECILACLANVVEYFNKVCVVCSRSLRGWQLRNESVCRIDCPLRRDVRSMACHSSLSFLLHPVVGLYLCWSLWVLVFGGRKERIHSL
jgi:hypothetical protein